MPFNGLTQYQAAVADPVFWRAVVNTILFTFFSILFQFTIGFLLALFFQSNFPLKNFMPGSAAYSVGLAGTDGCEHF